MSGPSDTPEASSPRPDRRMVLGGLAAATVAAGPVPAFAQSAPASAPLPADGQATVLLEAKPGVSEIAAGKITDIWGFGGRTPGPVLRMKAGDPFRARLVNSLPQPLALHWHGLRIPADMDGVAGLSLPPAAPGATFDVRFTPPDPGTAIYRPMVPGLTGEQTGRGLTGVCIVEERAPYPVDLDRVIAVADWRLGEDGQLTPFREVSERAGAGRLGNVLTVNGVHAPETIAAPPGARLRLRLANLCNARIMRIRFEGLKAYVIAIDGQPTDTFEPLRSTLPFAPGTRYDVVLDAPAQPGAAGRVVVLAGEGLTLAAISAEGDPVRRTDLPPVGPLPENKALPGAIPLQKAQRADMIIEGGARPGPGGQPVYTGDPERIWRVNGVYGPIGPDKSGRPAPFGKPLVSVRRGTPVVLAIANRTAFAQVIHVHGHVFRLLHAFDDGWEPYWLDTLIVPEGQTARIAVLADNRGRWLVGATVLERLDTGLSAWFEVT